MPTAQLTISANSGSTSLVLDGIDLKEPAPEHPLLADNYSYFSYYGCVGVHSLHHWKGVTATITTVSHTGRGQTKLFDKLVGPRIAALRLTMAREMRRIIDSGGICEVQQMDVHLDEDDVYRIQESIQACADDEEHTFFVWNGSDLGRFDVNNRLVWGRG